MSEVVAKLFALLGRVLMTCHGSLPIQPPSGLFCVWLESWMLTIYKNQPDGNCVQKQKKDINFDLVGERPAVQIS